MPRSPRRSRGQPPRRWWATPSSPSEPMPFEPEPKMHSEMTKNLTRALSERRTPATLVELLRARADARGGQTAYTFLSDGREDLRDGERGGRHADLRRVRPACARRRRSAPVGGRGRRARAAALPGGARLRRGLLRLPLRGGRRRAVLSAAVQPLAAALPLHRRRRAGRLRPHDGGHAVARRVALGRACGWRPRWLAVEEIADGEADVWREPELRSDSLAFLQYTSGSTRAPKGVMVTHANLLHNQR